MRQSAIIGPNLLLVVLLSAGCAGTQTAPEPSPPARPETAAAQPAADVVAEQRQRLAARLEKISRLLTLAEQALARDRLRWPAEDNAYDWYQQVLAIDELNSEAHWGMQRITRRYFELAEEAYTSGRPARAEQMLKGALQVAATPAQVERIREAHRDAYRDNTFALSPQALSRRSDNVLQQLADIATRAREQASRLLIVARSDAEGRWIYQQMRAAVDGYRLRGNIEVGDHPHVVLIDL